MAFLDALAGLVLTSVSNSLTHQNPSLLTGLLHAHAASNRHLAFFFQNSEFHDNF